MQPRNRRRGRRGRKRERETPVLPHHMLTEFPSASNIKAVFIRPRRVLCDLRLRNSHQILDVSLNIVRFQGVKRYAALRTAKPLLRAEVTNRAGQRSRSLLSPLALSPSERRKRNGGGEARSRALRRILCKVSELLPRYPRIGHAGGY